MIKNEKYKILTFLIFSFFIYLIYFILNWDYSVFDTLKYFEIEISESYFYDGAYDWVRSQGARRSGGNMLASVFWFLLSVTYWFYAWKYRRAVVTKIENLFSKFMNKL